MDLALNILKNSNLPIPDDVLNITSTHLMQTDSSILRFLEILKQIHDILNFNQSPV